MLVKGVREDMDKQTAKIQQGNLDTTKHETALAKAYSMGRNIRIMLGTRATYNRNECGLRRQVRSHYVLLGDRMPEYIIG